MKRAAIGDASATASDPFVEPVMPVAAPSRAPETDDAWAKQRVAAIEFFGHQPASTSALPDPRPLLENLTRCVIEVIAGVRELEQVARWVSDDVYLSLLKRVVVSARARQARAQKAVRPSVTIGSMRLCEPRDGVIEACLVVHSRVRVRAVAIRLEGMDKRWRATAITVL